MTSCDAALEAVGDEGADNRAGIIRISFIRNRLPDRVHFRGVPRPAPAS